jgi:hypothetical protein
MDFINPSSASSSPTPNPAPIPPVAPLTAQPNQVALLEHEIAQLKQRHKWLAISWWVFFILLVLSVFALAGLILWDTRSLRQEGILNGTALGERIDTMSINSQKNLQDRGSSIEARIDSLMQDYADLKAEMAAMDFKVDAAQQVCIDRCGPPSK